MFREFQPQDEVSLAAKVEEKGGVDYVRAHDTILRELSHYEDSIKSARLKATSKLDGNASSASANRDRYTKLRPEISERGSNLDNLKNDLHEDVKTAVARNMEVFELKFDLHKRQLQEGLFDVIHEDNDRVLQKLDAGPHDRIVNQVCPCARLCSTILNHGIS